MDYPGEIKWNWIAVGYNWIWKSHLCARTFKIIVWKRGFPRLLLPVHFISLQRMRKWCLYLLNWISGISENFFWHLVLSPYFSAELSADSIPNRFVLYCCIHKWQIVVILSFWRSLKICLRTPLSRYSAAFPYNNDACMLYMSMFTLA